MENRIIRLGPAKFGSWVLEGTGVLTGSGLQVQYPRARGIQIPVFNQTLCSGVFFGYLGSPIAASAAGTYIVRIMT